MQEKTSAQKPNNNRSNNKTKTTRGEKNMFSDVLSVHRLFPLIM